MNGTDPLAQLRDIHLPADIDWWPLAPGWWLVAATVLLALLTLTWAGWRRYRSRAYRRTALRQLDSLQRDCQSTSDWDHYCNELNQLLKRVALCSFERELVASLSGHAWLEFLDRQWGSRPAGSFCDNPALEQLYAPRSTSSSTTFDPDAATRLVRAWIKQHRALSC